MSQAKELETKMKDSQEKIKNITVEGVSGSNFFQSHFRMVKVKLLKIEHFK